MPATAILTQMVRTSMLESLDRDYVRTARSKGLSERRSIYGHALRNAMLPTIDLVRSPHRRAAERRLSGRGRLHLPRARHVRAQCHPAVRVRGHRQHDAAGRDGLRDREPALWIWPMSSLTLEFATPRSPSASPIYASGLAGYGGICRCSPRWPSSWSSSSLAMRWGPTIPSNRR